MAKQKTLLQSLPSAWSKTSWVERLLLLLLFTTGARPLLDPDFGWHLRSGIDLLKTGIVPKLDSYAYTLPNWPWVNHEWLSDGVVAFIYQYLGPLALVLVFAILIGFVFLLAASAAKADFKYKIVAGLIALLAALPILGVRMQVLTLLGMALTLWLLYSYRNKEIKHLWWMLPIFVLWANLHGGFTIGLVILALFFVVEFAKFFFEKWKPKIYKKLKVTEANLSWPQLKHLFIIGIGSGLVTLINPYGYGLYVDFYKLFINPYAIDNISEWQQVTLSSPISINFFIYLALFGIVMLLAYRKIEPTRWAITAVFLYLSFLYWRNMPFFMIMSVGFLAEIIQTHTSLVFDSLVRNRILTTVTTIIVAILVAQRVGDVVPKALDTELNFRNGGYPIDAVNWMKANPDKIGTRMFNEYGHGGFLVWQFPEQQVFVDGRMPFWQDGDKFVFMDNQYAVGAHPNSIQMIEEKYQVDWVIIRPTRPLDWALSGQDSWEQVYRDLYAVIYKKL
jgi:hypothetical protein